MIPTYFASDKFIDKLMNFGDVYVQPNVVHLCSELHRHELSELEAFLLRKKIPYDLYESSSFCNPPIVMKNRPEVSYVKEIFCFTHTGQVCGDEDGILPVSRIEEIINSSTSETLKELLIAEIKNKSFKYDFVREIGSYAYQY